MSTVAIIPALGLLSHLPKVRYISDFPGEDFYTVGEVIDDDKTTYTVDRIPYGARNVVGVLAECDDSKGVQYRIAHPDFPSRWINALAHITAVRAGEKQDSDDTLVITSLASNRQIVPDNRLERALLAYFVEQMRQQGFKRIIVNPHGKKEWPLFPGTFPPLEEAGFQLENGVWVKNLFSAFA